MKVRSTSPSAICAAVGPFVRSRGQFFVGIDVLGDYLTEINVTSPTGMQEINRLENLTGDATMQAKFFDALTNLGLSAPQPQQPPQRGQQTPQQPQSNSNYPSGMQPEVSVFEQLKAGDALFGKN